MRIFYLILFVIFCTFYILKLRSISKTKLKPNTYYRISGIISSDTLISDSSQTIKLGDFRIKTARTPKYSIGDRVKISGRLEERVINKFYRQFWFIYPEIKVEPKVKDKGYWMESGWLSFLKFLSDLRTNCENYFSRGLPNPQANLLSGILLGSKTSFSPDFYESLRSSGTLHIVVASGMNIVILSKVIFDILIKRFKRQTVIFVIFFCILIYTFLAGFEPPIIRASIMAFLTFSAQILGRPYLSSLVLFFAAGAMLLASPTLLFEVSFQLSLVATAGLIFIGPQVKEWFSKGEFFFKERGVFFGRLFGFFKADFIETVSAQVAVLPILLSTFGQFNLLSILPNVLIGFLVPGLMRYGLLYLLISFVLFPVAKILGFLLWVPLTYMVMVINFFGKIDFLTLKMVLPWWWGLFWWGGLYFSISRKRDLR